MNLNVNKTAYPDGTDVTWLFGMPKPKVVTYGELMKAAAKKAAIKNLPKPGGIAFSEQMECLLDDAKELLALNAKR